MVVPWSSNFAERVVTAYFANDIQGNKARLSKRVSSRLTRNTLTGTGEKNQNQQLVAPMITTNLADNSVPVLPNRNQKGRQHLKYVQQPRVRQKASASQQPDLNTETDLQRRLSKSHNLYQHDMMTTIREDEEGENRVETTFQNSIMDRQPIVLLSQTDEKVDNSVKREISFRPVPLDSISTVVQSNVAQVDTEGNDPAALTRVASEPLLSLEDGSSSVLINRQKFQGSLDENNLNSKHLSSSINESQKQYRDQRAELSVGSSLEFANKRMIGSQGSTDPANRLPSQIIGVARDSTTSFGMTLGDSSAQAQMRRSSTMEN